ncbi:unnamed protein product [Amoebophrya sp. A25]|nr:unnamed protein product [Amoebophrya sp. A25]|eukprot:GSA25T00018269001.1
MSGGGGPPEAASDTEILLTKIRGLLYETRSIGFRSLRIACAKSLNKANPTTGELALRHADDTFREASVFLSEKELLVLSRAYGNGRLVDRTISCKKVLEALIPTEEAMPERSFLADKVWAECAKAMGAEIDLIDFVEASNPKNYPHCKAGRVTYDECKRLLMGELESIMGPLGKAAVDAEVFRLYAMQTSCLCSLDAQFEYMMGMFTTNPNLIDNTLSRQLKLVDMFVTKFNEMKSTRSVLQLFQYYDTSKNFALSFADFRKLSIGVGVNISELEKRLVFDFFGPTGVIVCGPFLKYVFYLMEYETQKIGRPAEYRAIREHGPLAHDPDAEPRGLCAKIKKHLMKNHPRGLSVIFNVLHLLNRVGSKILRDDFQWGLETCGLRLGTAESEYLKQYFSGGTEEVDRDEFLDYLRCTKDDGDLSDYHARMKEAEARIEQVAPGPNEYVSADYTMKKWEPAFGGSKFIAAQFILDMYDVSGHPYLEAVGAKALTDEFFEYLGESLAIGRASKAKVVKYIVDEGLCQKDEVWRKYLYTCLPSRNPDENVLPTGEGA